MSLAHYFTLLRIFMIPLFPLLYLEYAWFGIPMKFVAYLLFVLLLICEFSDVFDGFFARKKNQVTDLGKVLDPMADSIMHITIFFTFTQGIVKLPLLLIFVFLYRELIMGTLRTLCAIRGIVLAARLSGKLKTFFQAVVSFAILILMMLFSQNMISLEFLQKMSFVIVLLAAIYSVVSAFDYFLANKDLVKKALSKS